MPEELNEIRLKEPNELTEDEVKVLKENEDDLTDEEKEDYKEVLGTGGEEKDEGEDEDDEDKDKDKEKPITFKTQEAFDTAVDKRVETLKTEAARKKKEKEEEAKEKRFWPKEKKFKDWDDYTKNLLPIIRKDRQTFTEQQRERRLEIDRQLDQETEDLRKIDSKIPKAGTKERREFDRSLAEIMIKDPKIMSITKAYGVYKGTQKSDAKKKKEDLAKKIGGGAGTGEEDKKLKYSKFGGRGMDEAQEAAEKKFRALS